jgi:DNA invertase Pin-like site-specific DNA recombinase
MNKKIALYVRTSTDKQEKGLESQIRTLKAHCEREGITDFEVFADEGVSGTKDSRPGLNRMLSAVRAGTVDGVLVYSFSRFARSTRFLVNMVEEFRKLNVEFSSYTEKVDTTTPAGKLFLTMIAAMAQFERDVTAERVRNGLANARAKGKTLGRPKKRQDAPILMLHHQGTPAAEIATFLGISRGAVYRAIRAAFPDRNTT